MGAGLLVVRAVHKLDFCLLAFAKGCDHNWKCGLDLSIKVFGSMMVSMSDLTWCHIMRLAWCFYSRELAFAPPFLSRLGVS